MILRNLLPNESNIWSDLKVNIEGFTIVILIDGIPDESKQRRGRAGNVRKLRECARLPSGKQKVVFWAIPRGFENFQR